MKFGTLVLLLAAIFIGGVAAYLAREIIKARPAGSHATLVVAAKPLVFGTELTAANVIEAPWSDSAVPEGAFASKDDLFKEGKRVALAPVEKNEPVLASRITGGNQKGGLSALIEPGMRAVTVRVDDVKGVAGFVTPGDRVDIVLIRNETRGDTGNSFADVLLQNVKVLGVDQLANASQETAAVAKAVTVEVTTEQAQKLVLAQGVGTLSLVLRKAGAENAEATRRVTSLDLGQGEYIEKMNESKNVAEPAAAPPASAPPVPQSATVRIFRGVTAAEYAVYREKRKF
jgi:pilus assembly protein CpaB